MNATLKAKTTIQCNTCGCALLRTRSFKVEAADVASAKIEASTQVAAWRQSLAGTNCKVCDSIIKAMA